MHTRDDRDVILAGTPVYSADGRELGHIADVEGSYFKVSAPLARDYWLSCDYVGALDADCVTLSITHAELDEHKLGEPGIEPEDDPFRRVGPEAVLSEREQLETRARMERELAEQRQRLPHAHPEGEDAPPDTGGTIGEPVESELPRLERVIEETPPDLPAMDAPPPPPDAIRRSGITVSAPSIGAPVAQMPGGHSPEGQRAAPAPEGAGPALADERRRRSEAQYEHLVTSWAASTERDDNRPLNGTRDRSTQSRGVSDADPVLRQGIVDAYPPSALGETDGSGETGAQQVERRLPMLALIGAAFIVAALWVSRRG